jgi:hypothetical protein
MIGCSAPQIVTNLPHSFEYDYNDIITVLVGENEENFTAHKDFICERSKYFEAACAPDRWLEGKEKVVPLKYLQPAAFKNYLHWMLTGELLSEIYWGHENITTTEDQRAHVEAYIVGDFLDDADYRGHTLQAIVTKIAAWKQCPNSVLITRVWESTPHGSILRTLFLEWMFARWSREPISEKIRAGACPQEFVTEALLMMLEHSKTMSRADGVERLRGLLDPTAEEDE